MKHVSATWAKATHNKKKGLRTILTNVSGESKQQDNYKNKQTILTLKQQQYNL